MDVARQRVKCSERAFVDFVASVDVAWQRVEMLQLWTEIARRQDQREAQCKACVCSRVHRMLSELGMLLWWAKFVGWRRQFEARVRAREGGGEDEEDRASWRCYSGGWSSRGGRTNVKLSVKHVCVHVFTAC